jgi:hypothetical protein
MSKQQRDIAFLIGACVLLAVVAYFSLKPSTPAPKPAPAHEAPPPNAAAAAQDAAKKAASGHVEWLTEELRAKAPQLGASLKAGRDPFKDFRGHATVNEPGAPPPVHDPANTNPLPPFPVPVAEKEHVVTKTLTWITPRMLAKTFDLQKLAVTMVAGRTPGSVVIRGFNPDFERALTLVGQLDIAPPVPTFVLAGVVATGAERYAALRVNGHFYTVMEGESIPRIGWRVTQIFEGGVTLRKGKQTVQLRLSGGSPS